MTRFSKDTQEIIDNYTKQVCDYVEEFTEPERYLETFDPEFRKIMEDFAWDIHAITCEHMVDID